MRGFNYMKLGVLVSFAYGAGYAHNELNTVPMHVIEQQARTAMLGELINMQSTSDVGYCIAKVWNAHSEEIKTQPD